MGRMIATFRLPVPAGQIWALVDWRGPAALAGHAYFRAVEFDGDADEPGATRRLVIDGRPAITERLEFIDHDRRRLGYRVLDAGDLPLADYAGAISVLPSGLDACLLAFEGDGIPCGMSFAELDSFYRDAERELYRAILRKLGLEDV